MKKLYLLSAALAVVLSGCMIDNQTRQADFDGYGDGVTAPPTSLNLRLSNGGRRVTRSLEGQGSTEENTNQIANAHVFILDGDGDVLNYASITTAADLELVKSEAGWVFPELIPSDSYVYVVSNVDAAYNKTIRMLESLEQINSFTSDIWTQTDYDYVTMVNQGYLPAEMVIESSEVARVKVALSPVVARLELHSLVGSDRINGFTVTGVFLTDYYTAFTYGGGYPENTRPINNSVALASNNGMTGDEASVIAEGTPLTAAMTGNRIWAYNVAAGSLPKMIIRLENVMIGSELHAGPMYLNVASYGSTTEFVAGRIYRIPSLTFTADHLSLTADPESGGIVADANEWTEEIIDPDVATPGEASMSGQDQALKSGFLYWDNDVMEVSSDWGNTVAANNLLYFKFGSVVGFVKDESYDYFMLDDVKYSPLEIYYEAEPSPIAIKRNTRAGGVIEDYDDIPSFNQLDYEIGGVRNVSSAGYNSLANLRAGRGDPCLLAGVSIETLMDESTTIEDIRAQSKWRLPTQKENELFIQGSYGKWTKEINGGEEFVFINGEDYSYFYWQPSADRIMKRTRTDWGSYLTDNNGGIFPVGPDGDTYNENGIFVPASGYCDGASSFGELDSTGYWWSSTALKVRYEVVTQNTRAYYAEDYYGMSLYFDSGIATHEDYGLFSRAYPVRCLWTGEGLPPSASDSEDKGPNPDE